MSGKFITAVTPASLLQILKEIDLTGSLVGTREAPRIASEVSGVHFNLCFGTRCKQEPGWTDFTLSAPFMIDQEVSPLLGSFWNRRNRFTRAYRIDSQIMLDMDVIVGGGVWVDNLKYQFAIWKDMVNLFVRHLQADQMGLARYKAARGASADGATAAATSDITKRSPVGPVAKNAAFAVQGLKAAPAEDQT